MAFSFNLYGCLLWFQDRFLSAASIKLLQIHTCLHIPRHFGGFLIERQYAQMIVWHSNSLGEIMQS